MLTLKNMKRIFIAKNESAVSYNIQPVNQALTCREMGGLKCDPSKNQYCSGAETYASDGACCTRQCAVEKGSSSWIWGVVLLLLLGAGAWFIYKKQKKTTGKEEGTRILQERTEKFRERMFPKHEPVEVRKSLTKI